MGFPSDKHIKKFVHGKTIDDITTNEYGAVFINFTDGDSLRLVPHVHRPEKPKFEMIATPFDSSGSVKQSTDI